MENNDSQLIYEQYRTITEQVKRSALDQPHYRPLSKLPTVKLWLNSHKVIAEVARTPAEHQVGMMGRTKIAEMEGMIFVFNEPDRRAFWMRNTHIPLDIAYLAPDGTLLEVHAGHPHNEVQLSSKSDNVQFVLEMLQGWFGRNNFKPGMIVRTENGSLMETIFPVQF